MKKILFVVDAQNDFMPGGALPVPNGDEIIPYINGLLKDDDYQIVWFSRDFHPANHTSFAKTHNVEPFTVIDGETKFPVHCLAGQNGAEIHKDIVIPLEYTGRLWGKVFDIPKGLDPEKEEFSALTQPEPNDFFINSTKDLTMANPEEPLELVFVGLALNICVKFTAIDAIKLLKNFNITNVKVVIDLKGCRGLSEESNAKAISEMQQEGIEVRE